MYLYDSLQQTRQRLRPSPGRPITVYVCGITPYDTTHLGHAFTYIVFDVLLRHLEVARGWQTRYVQNLTDIDDDILRKADETGSDWRELGLSWTRRFREDMAWLGMRPPDVYPGATSALPEIIANVASLVDAGRAYTRAGSVYFRVASDPDFGVGLDLDPEALLDLANRRGNLPDDPAKSDPIDFVLWQAAKAGEPAWHSPWGPGRPGWHIECSSLAMKHLGRQVDIHGGGGDLAFPHHACERAQCRTLATAKPWTRFWVHAAMVEMDGEKMSKSLGNLVMVRELSRSAQPDTVRLYLLRHGYRQSWQWDPARFEETRAWTRTLHAAMRRSSGSGRPIDVGRFGPRFTQAMEDDLDTPSAVAVVLELADAIIAAPPASDLRVAQDLLRATAGRILGLRLEPFDTPPEALETIWPEPLIEAPDLIYAAPVE
ncbi:MAG: cysteine--tRNA ligase [Caldilineae bacterium]|nr:cysteine--tRNA ligase [Chloroflexota bacterium]MCB9175644.1 cysteine--tRNA ligase [Caldilineae bacterium]